MNSDLNTLLTILETHIFKKDKIYNQVSKARKKIYRMQVIKDLEGTHYWDNQAFIMDETFKQYNDLLNRAKHEFNGT